MVGEIEVMQMSRRIYHSATKTDVILLICKSDYFLELIK